jgi:hypothetical protein
VRDEVKKPRFQEIDADKKEGGRPIMPPKKSHDSPNKPPPPRPGASKSAPAKPAKPAAKPELAQRQRSPRLPAGPRRGHTEADAHATRPLPEEDEQEHTYHGPEVEEPYDTEGLRNHDDGHTNSAPEPKETEEYESPGPKRSVMTSVTVKKTPPAADADDPIRETPTPSVPKPEPAAKPPGKPRVLGRFDKALP